ncbi:MAG: type II toxin-antitoxin system HicB family antitoxin [Dehalococcoidia bacterium]|nr:type II toxin-antitoxin system HicB family antitoxin [Dehalococcoidia bacterium]
MKSHIFRVELSQDEDGRWNAVIPTLRACYTWGNTKEEALAYIQDALRCCLEDMMAYGEALLPDVEVIDAPVAAVTL